MKKLLCSSNHKDFCGVFCGEFFSHFCERYLGKRNSVTKFPVFSLENKSPKKEGGKKIAKNHHNCLYMMMKGFS